MKKLLIIALALLSVSIVRADEGMWLLSKLKPLNIEKMQQMGFKLTAEDIYDVNKPGIKDAIVGLGMPAVLSVIFVRERLFLPMG